MTRQNHFIYLLFALLLFLVVLPIADDHTLMSEPMLRLVSFSCLFFVGIISLRESGRIFKMGLVLAAAGFVLNFLGVSSFGGSYVHGSLITLFLFLLLAIWASMKRVVTASRY